MNRVLRVFCGLAQTRAAQIDFNKKFFCFFSYLKKDKFFNKGKVNTIVERELILKIGVLACVFIIGTLIEAYLGPNIIKFVVNILDRMITKDNKLTSWIIVESIKSRMDVIYELENESKVADLHRDAILNARCTVYSRDYAENYKYSDIFKRDVIITIDVHNFKKLSNTLPVNI